jgi:CheY-like chemotaxis protein
VVSDEDDRLVFMDEEDMGGDLPPPSKPRPWSVLIVDDDEEVHSVTRLALDSFTFRGRPLAFTSAYSASEAMALLEAMEEVAVILLDVVMESDDAGLRVVRFTRDKLGNQSTRIILRTGQPGQAPEHDLIVEYDINDYKSKTELTLSKLYTMMVSSLRSFEQIQALQTNRHALRRLLGAAAQVFRTPQAKIFSDSLLERIATQLDSPITGALCLREAEGTPRVLASWGQLRQLPEAEPKAVLTEQSWRNLRALPLPTEMPCSIGGSLSAIRVESPVDGHPLALVMVTNDGRPPDLSEADALVLRLFCENIADQLETGGPIGSDSSDVR